MKAFTGQSGDSGHNARERNRFMTRFRQFAVVAIICALIATACVSDQPSTEAGQAQRAIATAPKTGQQGQPDRSLQAAESPTEVEREATQHEASVSQPQTQPEAVETRRAAVGRETPPQNIDRPELPVDPRPTIPDPLEGLVAIDETRRADVTAASPVVEPVVVTPPSPVVEPVVVTPASPVVEPVVVTPPSPVVEPVVVTPPSPVVEPVVVTPPSPVVEPLAVTPLDPEPSTLSDQTAATEPVEMALPATDPGTSAPEPATVIPPLPTAEAEPSTAAAASDGLGAPNDGLSYTIWNPEEVPNQVPLTRSSDADFVTSSAGLEVRIPTATGTRGLGRSDGNADPAAPAGQVPIATVTLTGGETVGLAVVDQRSDVQGILAEVPATAPALPLAAQPDLEARPEGVRELGPAESPPFEIPNDAAPAAQRSVVADRSTNADTVAAVQFESLLDSVDVHVRQQDGAVKTTYVVETPEAMRNGIFETVQVDPSWQFEQTGEIITANDAAGNARVQWVGGPAWDAAGATSNATLALKSSTDGVAVAQVEVPQEWWQSPDRVYPITIDPELSPNDSGTYARISSLGAGSMPSENQPGFAALNLDVRVSNVQGNLCWAFQVERWTGSTWVDHIGLGDDWIIYQDNCRYMPSFPTHSPEAVTGIVAAPSGSGADFENGTKYRVTWRLAIHGFVTGSLDAASTSLGTSAEFTVTDPPRPLGPSSALESQTDVQLHAEGQGFLDYQWALGSAASSTLCPDVALAGTTATPEKTAAMPATGGGERLLWCVRGRTAAGTGMPYTAWAPMLLSRSNVERSKFFGEDPLFILNRGVNAASGNWTFDRTDIELNGVAPGLAVRRTYNSQNEVVGSFGRGFSAPFDTHIRVVSVIASDTAREHCYFNDDCGFDYVDYRTQTVVYEVVHPDGSAERFQVLENAYRFDGIGNWTIRDNEASGIGTSKELIWDASGWYDKWTLAAPDGSEYRFDDARYLAEIEDPGGSVLEYTRGAGSRVTKIRDEVTGRSIDIEWARPAGSPRDRIVAASTSAPDRADTRTWTFDYADNGNQLIEACDSRTIPTFDFCERYDWTANKLAIDTIYNKAGEITTEVVYDEDMRVETVTTRPDATTANTVLFAYTGQLFEAGSTTTVTDARSNIWSYTFDENGQVTSKDAPDIGGLYPGVTTYEYDKGRRTLVSAPYLNSNSDAGTAVDLRFEYDETGNLTKEIDGGGIETTFHYDSYNRLTAECDGRASANPTSEFCVTYTYSGNLVASRSWYYEAGLKATESWLYDGNGQVTRHTDASGRVTTYAYYATADESSAVGDLSIVTYPSGLQHQFQYNRWGSVKAKFERLRSTDAWTSIEEHSYNTKSGTPTVSLGPIITNPISGNTHRAAIERSYNVENRLLWQDRYDALQPSVPRRRHTYSYDRLGRETRRILPEMINSAGSPFRPDVETTYDANGNVMSVCDARDICTVRTYDSRNRLGSVSRAGISLENYLYWDSGEVREFEDGAGRLVATSYNRSGDAWLVRARTTTDDAWNVEQYVLFHPDTTLPSVVKAGGPWVPTGDGTYSSEVEFAYHPNSDVSRTVEKLAGQDRTTWTHHEPDGQLSRRIVAGEGSTDKDRTDYAYDASGHLETVTVDAETEALVTTTIRDPRGLVITQIDPENNRTQFAYDVAGQLTRQTMPETDTYGDHAVNPARSRPIDVYGYDAFGNLTDHRAPAPGFAVTSYTHDNFDRIVQTVHPLITGISTPPRDTVWYDANGNVTQQQDALGGITVYYYDDFNRPVQTTDAEGHTSTIAYDVVGNMISSTDGDGRQVTYTYDYRDKVTSQTIIVGAFAYVSGFNAPAETQTTIYTYDSLGYLATVDTPELPPSKTIYDPFGRLQQLVDSGGAVTTTTYNFRDQPTRIDAPGGFATAYNYDSAGRLLSQSDLGPNNSLRSRTTYTYDDNNNVISETSQAGVRTKYLYDEHNRLVETRLDNVNPNIVTTFGYDERGNLAYLEDGNGNVTTTTWNEWNRRAQVREPIAPAAAPEPALVAEAVAALEAYAADHGEYRVRGAGYKGFGGGWFNSGGTANYPKSVKQALIDGGYLRADWQLVGAPMIYHCGDRVAVFANSVAPPSATDVALWAPPCPQSPISSQAKNYYQVARPLADATSANSRLGTATPRAALNDNGDDGGPVPADQVDAPVREVLQLGAEAEETPHDPDPVPADQVEGPVREAPQPGAETEETPDNPGPAPADHRLNPPLGNTNRSASAGTAAAMFEYHYDAAGNLSQMVLPPGDIIIGYQYDLLGRLRREESGQASREFDYDAAGNVTNGRASGTSEIEFRYDDTGQLVESKTVDGSSYASFAYDRNGRLTWRLDGLGTTPHQFTWTARDELDRHTHGSLVADHTWNPAGNLTRIDYLGISAHRELAYDAAGRLASDEWFDGATRWSARRYAYDADSRVASEQVHQRGHSWNTHHYTYDGANRLTNFTVSDGKVTGAPAGTIEQAVEYRYDSAGNRTHEIDGTTVDQWSYNARNQIETGPDGTYLYTPRGTLASIASAGTDTTYYTFDAFGQMVGFYGPTNVSYAYDPFGRIAERTSIDSTSTFAYSGASRDPKNTITDGQTVVYGRSPGGILTSYGTPGAEHIAAVDRYGDLMHLADRSTGEVIESRTYEPFGGVLNEWGSLDTPLVGFQGDYTDPDSGEVLMDARWYSPTSGAFRSRDTFNGDTSRALSFNRYSYGGNNPISYWDPTGLDWDDYLYPDAGSLGVVGELHKDLPELPRVGQPGGFFEASQGYSTATWVFSQGEGGTINKEVALVYLDDLGTSTLITASDKWAPIMPELSAAEQMQVALATHFSAAFQSDQYMGIDDHLDHELRYNYLDPGGTGRKVLNRWDLMWAPGSHWYEGCKTSLEAPTNDGFDHCSGDARMGAGDLLLGLVNPVGSIGRSALKGLASKSRGFFGRLFGKNADDVATKSVSQTLPNMERAAKTAANNALTHGKESGAASGLLTHEGHPFVGISGRVGDLHPVLRAELEAIPVAVRPGWHAHCSEISCINQTLHAGVDPAGEIFTVAIGRSIPGHGLLKDPCPTCTIILRRFGVNVS